MRTRNIPEIDNLSELIGEFIEYWGFKKIHGKIWFHIFISPTPLDAKDLMERLGISKALVSISIRDLMEYDVIFEGPLSAEGTRTYYANDDIGNVVEHVLRMRERVMIGKIKASFQNLKEVSDEGIKASQLKQLEKLINKGDKMLGTVMSLL